MHVPMLPIVVEPRVPVNATKVPPLPPPVLPTVDVLMDTELAVT
jgi:hypothetical protein